MYRAARSGCFVFATMFMTDITTTAPSLGTTQSTGSPFPRSARIVLFHRGAIATSSRSKRAASAPGRGATADTLDMSVLYAWNPGSMFPSPPPLMRANITRKATPRELFRLTVPTCPLYSGRKRSRQDVGRVLIFFVLYAMPTTEYACGTPNPPVTFRYAGYTCARLGTFFSSTRSTRPSATAWRCGPSSRTITSNGGFAGDALILARTSRESDGTSDTFAPVWRSSGSARNQRNGSSNWPP